MDLLNHETVCWKIGTRWINLYVGSSSWIHKMLRWSIGVVKSWTLSTKCPCILTGSLVLPNSCCVHLTRRILPATGRPLAIFMKVSCGDLLGLNLQIQFPSIQVTIKHTPVNQFVYFDFFRGPTSAEYAREILMCRHSHCFKCS